MTKESKNSKFLKIIYFDEVAANDFVTIKNGGKIDWSTIENKERLAKLVAEIDNQAKTGFNFFLFLRQLFLVVLIQVMYSSYLNVVPKEEIPIDLTELNKAILGDRGYYQMLLGSEPVPKTVLRFNINAFKNSYALADLSKMNLTYYGIKVGACTINQLSMENEFKFEKKKMK